MEQRLLLSFRRGPFNTFVASYRTRLWVYSIEYYRVNVYTNAFITQVNCKSLRYYFNE